MPDRMRFDEQVTIGAQPSEAEIKAMADDGVKTVINLRTDGEDLQPMRPEEEARCVRGHGMAYVSLPVSLESAGPPLVDAFRRALGNAETPVFVHCKLGKRAGAFVMMDRAVREGWNGEQTLDKAREMGFECDNERMVDFVRGYVDQQKQGLADR